MPTEQLKVDAALDTKNLKRESKDAAQEVSNSLNEIGNAADNAASKMEQSFKSSFNKINAQAEQVKKTMKSMAAVGIAAQAANIVGGAIAQTEWGQTVAGRQTSSALTGAGTGAMSGMTLGAMVGGPVGAGIGAAAGALIGAGKGLMDASAELKAAAREQKQNAQSGYESRVKDFENAQNERNWNRRLQSYADTYGNAGTPEKLDKEIDAYTETIRKNQEAQQKVIESTNKQVAQIDKSTSGSKKDNDKLISNVYKYGEEELSRLADEQQDAQKKLNDLITLRTNLQAELARKEEEEKRALDAKIKADEAAAKTAQAKADVDAKKAAQEERKYQINSLKADMASNKETQSEFGSQLSRATAQSRTLSDSLVRVGGGGGYGQINSAINSNVAKIAQTINQLLKTAQSQYALLQSKLNALTNTAEWSQ